MENNIEDESSIKQVHERHGTKFRINKLEGSRLGLYIIKKKLAGGSFG